MKKRGPEGPRSLLCEPLGVVQNMPSTIAERNAKDMIAARTFSLILISIVASFADCSAVRATGQARP